MAALVAPAAVRVVDLERPLEDMHLTRGPTQERYRSVLVVVHVGREPIGVAAWPVDPDGVVPRARLVRELHRSFGRPLKGGRGRRSQTINGQGPTPAPQSTNGGVVAQHTAPFVSVVVPTCGSTEALEPCLGSLLGCEYGDFEIIVVDNRPSGTDTRSTLARVFQCEPRVRYLAEHRPGASAARNAGLANAAGEVVAFVDDDVVVEPGWIRANVEALLTGADDVGCVTGLILPQELGSESQILLEQFGAFGKGFQRRTFRLPPSRAENPLFPYTPGAFGSGASMAFRADLLRELGGFDCVLGPATPTRGGEDLDIFIRVLRAGHALSYEPRAVVWHRHPEGMPRLRRQAYGYGVGLGALMAKQLIAGPARSDFLRAVPAGVRYARDPASRKNAGKPADYPRSLSRLERLGMLVGPGAYLLSALRLLVLRLVHVERANRPVPAAGLLLGAAIACVAAPLLVALGAPAPLSFAVVLGFMCVGPGTAFLSVVGGRFEPALVIGASAAATAAVAQSMLWLGIWRPRACLYALAAVCLVPVAGRLRASPPELSCLRRIRDAANAVPRATMLHACLLSFAVLSWGAALSGADLGRIGGVGLLNALPPTYFLLFPLLLVGFATAVTSDQVSPKLLAAYVLALILVIHATTAVLYSEPRYAWVYKHLGVINLIAHTGHADRDIDIYNNWPAFFAANAWLSRATGLPPLAYAGWAQLFFNMWGAFAVRFALRGLTRDERLVWTATLFFVLGNWVGQDYLAPQAFGFVLSLVVLGLCLRCGRIGLRRGHGLPSPPIGPRAALLVGGVCFLAVVTSHQLSPVVLILSVACLAVFVRAVPLWVPAVMAAIEAWWLALAWAFLTRHFTLIEPATSGAAAPGRDLAHAVPGAVFAFYSPAVVMAVVAAVALLGAVRRYRAGHRDLAPICLIGAPALAVLVQSYGGEGPYRAYLFALPWLAFFAATACSPSPTADRDPSTSTADRGAPISAARFLAAASAVGVCFLFAYFGQELADHITAQDVQAAAWYERNAPPGSIRVELAPNAPNRLTARYPLVSLSDPPSLLETPGFTGHRLGAGDLPLLERFIGKQRTRAVFVVLSRSQESYARLNGLLPKGSAASLARALPGSRRFVLVYHNSSAWIFRYLPRRKR